MEPSLLSECSEKRFDKHFMQLEKVGVGGYASVYRVKNILDNNLYAVKKIQLRVKDVKTNFEQEVYKVLGEARNLAKINHPNIIRYYQTWIEARKCDKSDKMDKIVKIKDFKQDKIDLKAEVKPENGRKKSMLSTAIKKQQNTIVEKTSEKHTEKLANAGNIEKKRSPLHAIKENWLTDLDSFQLEEDCMSPPFEIDTQNLENYENDVNFDDNLVWDTSEEPKYQEKNGINGSPTGFSTTTQGTNGLDELKNVTIYLQMELCNQNLGEYLTTRNKKLENARLKSHITYEAEFTKYQEEAKFLTKQLIDSLYCIHREWNLVHRDLKPSNIFLTENMQLKLGDFGLVKKLETMTAMMPSPHLGPSPPPQIVSSFRSEQNIPLRRGLLNEEKYNDHGDFEKNSEKSRENDGDIDDFVMTIEEDQYQADSPPNSLKLIMDRAQSYSPNIHSHHYNHAGKIHTHHHQYSSSLQLESLKSITRSIGTPTYSSPEQLSANAMIFDQRADIWSLALVILQLFWPMNTVMEQMKVLKQAREGHMPEKFCQSNPTLAVLLQNMLKTDPKERPDLEEIRETLKNMSNELGVFECRLENSKKWKRKVLKVRDAHLYCFPENETKADSVFNLTDTLLKMEDNMLRISLKMQFGCIVRSDSPDHLERAFRAMENHQNNKVCVK